MKSVDELDEEEEEEEEKEEDEEEARVRHRTRLAKSRFYTKIARFVRLVASKPKP